MKKVVEFIKNKKKIIAIVLAAIVVIVVGSIIVLKITKKEEVSEKDRITKELETLGKKYYEDYYYPSSGNSEEENSKEKYLKNFESVGLKINLENLQRYNNTLSKKDKVKTDFTNKDKKKKCDAEKTMVTIYPKEPFGKKDYKISVYVECGF